MALQWHPVLVELLKASYADRLIIQEEVQLGELPLEADILLIRRDPKVVLPYPLEFLGQRTLVEFKSPDDTADQGALQQLEIYGLLYVRRERLRRRDLTLWLLASQFAANVSQADGAELLDLQEVGPGVRRGTLDKFPTFLVDLQQVPFSPETVPLHMVSRGQQEHALVDYLIERYRDYPRLTELLLRLHANTLTEVLTMHNLTADEVGIDYEALFKLLGPEKALKFIGPERALKFIGPKRALEILGPEAVAEQLDKEKLVELLLKKYGEQEIRQTLERASRRSDEASGPEPSSN